MTTELKGRRVTVMGLGSFGGGVGAVRFLSGAGARVTVTDLKSADALARSLEQVRDCPGVTLHLGEHHNRDFAECDLVVVSPGVPSESPYLQIARDAGVPLTTEMNLFWERNRGRTIGVTGSSGKSTTAALVHALLGAAQAARRETTPGGAAGGLGNACWLGGNIGISLLPEVDRIQPDDWVVLELSSFQLADLAVLRPNPHVAIVTNFSPNHLDRHGTLDDYRDAKQNLLRWQTPDRLAILNQSDPDVRQWRTAARRVWFGRDDEGAPGMFAMGIDAFRGRALYRSGTREQVLPLGDWLQLPGRHNFQNALAAACAVLSLGGTAAEVASGLQGFRGLPHRLQFVVEAHGRRFVNDSKATTPVATLLALEAIRAPVVLLAGGYDKQVDLSELARGIVTRGVKAVALLGETAETLKGLIRAADSDGRVTLRTHVTFEGAFQWAVAQSAPADTVLLSPGCASYDWFPNYEVRGEEFSRLSRAWAGLESHGNT
jgi:UDP-N-acetylmuramoylalanine--D-glutamate ligase